MFRNTATEESVILRLKQRRLHVGWPISFEKVFFVCHSVGFSAIKIGGQVRRLPAPKNSMAGGESRTGETKTLAQAIDK